MLSLVMAIQLIGGPATPSPIHRRGATPEWLQFNSSTTSVIAPPKSNVPKLARAWQTALPEPSDGSPAFVTGVRTTTDNATHDLLIIATTAGRTVAVDAHTGSIVWKTSVPAGPQWTTSSAVVDPNRRFVYAYALDGFIHKYRIENGTEITGNGWPELVTLKGDVEKGSSALSLAQAANGRTYLYATTAGYPIPGDAGDYQGHLVTIDLASGSQNTFNAACSDKLFHFVENGDAAHDCSNVQAGIWARAGAVYDSTTDRVFITTGNGVFDADSGGFNWADSVIALRPDGSSDQGAPADSYTPENHEWMDDNDVDLASSAVAILPLKGNAKMPRLAVQGGKDWSLRLLNLRDLSGQTGPRHLGGELQIIQLPQGGEVDTRPATWTDTSGTVWVFVATDLGLSGFSLATSGGSYALIPQWTVDEGGKTPIVANGVLYYAHDHQIVARDCATGEHLWSDGSIGTVHWQSPIVIEDALYIADNDGYLTAYTTVP
jgi:outer membrane protein assembly factor BamB